MTIKCPTLDFQTNILFDIHTDYIHCGRGGEMKYKAKLLGRNLDRHIFLNVPPQPELQWYLLVRSNKPPQAGFPPGSEAEGQWEMRGQAGTE